MTAINLYWYNRERNFGDMLSAEVVAHLSGRPVNWTAPEEADLFAIGSIMKHVRTGALKNRDRPVHVWGTGCMDPLPVDFLENAVVHAVRGPVTAALLNLDSCKVGDPGLLASNLFTPPERKDKPALIPHFGTWGNGGAMRARRRAAEAAGADIIDVRGATGVEVCKLIAGYSYILTESLHGGIVADSLGIANSFLYPKDIHRFAYVKFHDYCLSVGRAWGKFADRSEITANLTTARSANPPDPSLVAEVKEGLIASFPRDLGA